MNVWLLYRNNGLGGRALKGVFDAEPLAGVDYDFDPTDWEGRWSFVVHTVRPASKPLDWKG